MLGIKENKVFVLKSNKSGQDVRKFYESLFFFGQLHKFAEDVKLVIGIIKEPMRFGWKLDLILILKMHIDIHLQNNLYIQMELYSKFS